MHPAPSIILFSVLTGLGFGLMGWLGIGTVALGCWAAGVLCALALGLAATGLTASLFHLGQPTRFLKAFSQWRSSWLSREAVAACATLAAFALYAGLWVLFDLRLTPLGYLVTALAAATVFCTAMIYAQMQAVPRWRSGWTPATFLLASAAGGGLLAGAPREALWLLAAFGAAQVADWLLGDRRLAASGTTMATATGLGRLGRLRLLEPPHTGNNYLLREMVFVTGRRHARKLRLIGLGLAVALPLAFLLVLPQGHVAAGLAILSHTAGILALRWLFFAQAEHVVGIYYGKR